MTWLSDPGTQLKIAVFLLAVLCIALHRWLAVREHRRRGRQISERLIRTIRDGQANRMLRR